MSLTIETAFMARLEEYLKTRPFKGFKATPRYSEEGDCLTFYFRNAPSYADRVDELLTVYLSLEADEISWLPDQEHRKNYEAPAQLAHQAQR